MASRSPFPLAHIRLHPILFRIGWEQCLREKLPFELGIKQLVKYARDHEVYCYTVGYVSLRGSYGFKNWNGLAKNGG